MSYPDPQLVKGRPDLVSVWMLGERVVVEKAWFLKVSWIASCSQHQFDIEFDKARHGEPSMLDISYWEQRAWLTPA